MTQPLFDLAKCNVPFVRSVDFRFVSECSIQPPPPPIFDCPEPPKTFRVVPECPSIDGSIYVSVGTEGCVPKRNKITVTKTPRCGGNEEAGCNFFLDIDMTVPIPPPPCPSIKGGSIKTSVFFQDCKQPKNSIKIRKRSLARNDCAPSKPNCVHTIDIEIDIPIPRPPCPSISGGSVSLSITHKDCTPPKNKIKVKKRSLPANCPTDSKANCVHVIDLDLTIPVPKISCPKISITNDPAPRASITRKKRTAASCKNALTPPPCEFTINIPPPPCPVISAGSVSLSITHATCVQPKKNKIKARKLPSKPSSACRFAIDLDLAIPVPKVSCPLISITNEPATRPSITQKKTTAASCGNALTPPRCKFTINIPPPPCPVISAGSFSVEQNYDITKPSGLLRTRKLEPKPGSSCRFAIDIGIKLPLPVCPVISAGSFSVEQNYDITKPSGLLKTRKLPPKPGSSCRFAIDIGIKLPLPVCPEISAGSFSIVETADVTKPSGLMRTRKLEPKPGSSCRIAFDLDIKLPKPPCPEISKGSFSITETNEVTKPSGLLKVRKLEAKPGSSCRFGIDLNIKLPKPPCPEISKGSFSITETNEVTKPSGLLKVRKLEAKPGSSCRFGIDLNIKLPKPPCPEISKGSFSITETNEVTKPSGLLKVRKLEAKPGSSCRFGLDINIKLPKPPCPEISKGSFSITETNEVTKPSGLLKVRKLEAKPGSSCRFGLDINIKLPKPPCPEISKGSFSITETNEVTKPSGLLKVRKLEAKPGSSCRFGIDLNIKLPKPPCPEISKGSFSITETSEVTKPSGLLKVRKLEAKPGSSCRFGIDLNIKLPKPPCPEISKGSFSITETNEVTKPSGLLKVRKLEAKPGSSCRFGIDLNIKLPKPPCPEISKGSFSITETNEVTKPSGLLKVRKLEAKPGSSCRFGIDLNIKLPKPPCPEISKGSFSITETNEVTKPSGLLKVRKLEAKPGSSCRFGIDLNIKLPKPPCPEISKGSFSITETNEVTKPSGLLKVRKLDAKPGSSCRFGLDINIKLPKPPCPEISKGSFSITETNEVTKPSGLLKVRKLDPKPGSSCRFGIDINMKLPKPPCPEISIGKFSLRVFDPSGPDEKATGFLRRKKLDPRPGSSCREGLSLEIQIPVPKELYTTTATGEWNKGSTKSLTVNSETHAVTNNIKNINDTGSYEVIVGKIYDEWVLVNHEHRYCNTTGTYAKDVSGNNVTEASSTSSLEEGDGAQVLVNDSGCAKWFSVKKQKIIYDLEAYNKGLKWKEREVWVLMDQASAQPKEIECSDIGAEYVGGTIDLGAYGSGTINVTGDCPTKTIDATITLNTTQC